MCLLFFNINDTAKDDEFAVVLANNRDEFWVRPTKAADYWSNNTCISGLDQEPGREGGTWFGINIYGRIGCLVNISSQQELDKKGRGFLVSDFLTSQDTTESYSQQIASEKDLYNGFTLTLIELQTSEASRSKVVQVTNDRLADVAISQTHPSSDDFFAVGNSPIHHPWRKISGGKEIFSSIVKEFRNVSCKQKLQEDLFEMMADKTIYMPDAQLKKQGEECGWKDESVRTKSAVFVWDPEWNYGTRTTTVLLIDGQGNCDYIEKTLETPVNVDSPQWSTTHRSFTLQPRQKLQAELRPVL